MLQKKIRRFAAIFAFKKVTVSQKFSHEIAFITQAECMRVARSAIFVVAILQGENDKKRAQVAKIGKFDQNSAIFWQFFGSRAGKG